MGSLCEESLFLEQIEPFKDVAMGNTPPVLKLQENGPAAADLAKVKQSWLTSHRRALRENALWIGQLQAAQLNGFAPESILGFEERAAAVTPADVQGAAQRYFDFDNYVQVVLYPEAG